MLALKLTLALLLGAFVFVFTAFNKSDEKSLVKFITKKENFIAVILNIVTGLIIIFAWIDDPTALMVAGISEITFLTAAILGFTANGIWNSLTESTSKRVKTKVGANK